MQLPYPRCQRMGIVAVGGNTAKILIHMSLNYFYQTRVTYVVKVTDLSFVSSIFTSMKLLMKLKWGRR